MTVPGAERPRWLLPASVFLAGAEVMVLELLGTRLVPHDGAPGDSWSALIAVTLVSLAAGSWLGGRYSDRAPRVDVFFRLLAAAALLIAVVPFASAPVQALTASLPPRVAAFAAAGLLFLVPLTLLGMAPPFAVRLAARELGSVGRTAGRLGALSTAGSLAGTIVTGLLLMPRARVEECLAVAAAVLLIPPLIDHAWRRFAFGSRVESVHDRAASPQNRDAARA
jgi:MFS family permease